MRKEKFTNGPWVNGWNGGKTGPTCPGDEVTVSGRKWEIIPIGIGVETCAIAVRQEGKNGLKEMESNAHLIAAAPELYEALTQLIDDLSNTDEEGLFEHSETVIRCRLALSKARGES